MPLAIKKKKADIKQNAEGTTSSAASRRKNRKGPGSNRAVYFVAAAVVAVALAVFGVAYYQTYVAPFRRAIITVDNAVIVRMDYFLERARLSGSSGMGTLQSLTNEQLIKFGAERFGISVTPQDIEQELRSRAEGSDNVTISDAEFREWYRQLLNDSKVSDGRYRETVRNTLLSSRLQDYLSLQIPAALDHAHVYGIFVSTYEEAAEVKERVEAGEDFNTLARELSLDPSKENGGELDWFPKGVLVDDKFDPFSLEVGAVSDPLAIIQDPNEAPSVYYVLTVTETAVREIEDRFVAEVRSRGFQDWLNEETKQHTVRWGGWDGKEKTSYGSTTDAWVNWQLTKDKPKS
jgi:parvulin-like peptidyl-prolyl isomerase